MRSILLAVLLVFLLAQPVLAFAGEPPQATPVPAQAAAPAGGFPWLALLVFLAPLGIVLWKSRGKKEPDIRSAACMPVIDEKKSPFAPQDDEG